jgi:hypothetical protein
MDFGKIRSQVVKISKPGGKFEMKTPNAVIGVIGTDFYVGFESNSTTVICYKGKVSVTPTNGAHAANNSGQSDAASNSVTVSAGQMVARRTRLKSRRRNSVSAMGIEKPCPATRFAGHYPSVRFVNSLALRLRTRIIFATT